jgi:uncharacterized radical SAM protein YgiQ
MPTAPLSPAFIPTTPEELLRLGWPDLDVILVISAPHIGVAVIAFCWPHIAWACPPHIGVAVIGRVLLAAGYRVGIIAQPEIQDGRDIARLGEPRLFWGVTGGSVDSMVANYTPSGRRRKSDDLTAGGRNTRRPDRAVLVYSHLIRRHFKQTRPIVLGGIEASLRRISHYDAWSDAVRRSVLFDAKADFLLYGMADQSVLALAEKLQKGEAVHTLRGLCYICRGMPPPDPQWDGPDVVLPDHATARADKKAFARMFALFYENAAPATGRRLIQQQDTRYLVQNPPPLPPAPAALDAVYALPFARAAHPFTGGRTGGGPGDHPLFPDHPPGLLRRMPLLRHRGPPGPAGGLAQPGGHRARSRRPDASPCLQGIISDVGGPTANMYGMGCRSTRGRGGCTDKGCLFPGPCKTLDLDHRPQIRLLRALRRIAGC